MSKLEKCPVCDGRGFVNGNFYDVAGQTCSFGDYAKKQQSSTICMYCNGKGVANIGYIPEGEVEEIFEEIDCIFRDFYKICSQKSDMPLKEMLLQGERFVINEMWHEFAELKKKYIGDKQRKEDEGK